MTILGEAALTDIDLVYAKFADAFEKDMYHRDTIPTDRLKRHWRLDGSCCLCCLEQSSSELMISS